MGTDASDHARQNSTSPFAVGIAVLSFVRQRDVFVRLGGGVRKNVSKVGAESVIRHKTPSACGKKNTQPHVIHVMIDSRTEIITSTDSVGEEVVRWRDP